MSTQREVVIRGETIQRAFSWYVENRFAVNRRYQRKLVWTLEEKQQLIDSISSKYPLPLFLLAEAPSRGSTQYEIIDGMQRFEAIFSFVEGAYSVSEKYFDLTSIPETKQLLDSGTLTQNTPVLDLKTCATVASYQLPFSIYRDQDTKDIDKIFQRLNSGGHQLSRQELRHAGATGAFAQAVRQIASKIRGDASSSDRLTLAQMRKLSISGKGLAYGLNVEELFWIRNQILTREMVRESRDEEIVADMLAFTLLSNKPPSNSEALDEFFGLRESGNNRMKEVEEAVAKRGVDVVLRSFLAAHDDILETLQAAKESFGQLMAKTKKLARMPRYYQSVFLAFNQLHEDHYEMKTASVVATKLNGFADKHNIEEGGKWGAEQRSKLVDQIVGLVKTGFRKIGKTDPKRTHSITEIDNILTQSKTENGLYDFKQGLLLLDGKNKEDPALLSNILETLTAIANAGPGVTGYVLLGICDKPATVKRIRDLYGAEATPSGAFWVTGIDHETKHIGGDIDKFYQSITSRIGIARMSLSVRSDVLAQIRCLLYYGKTVIVFAVSGVNEPASYDGEYFVRKGPNNCKLEKTELVELTKRLLERSS